MLEVWDIDFYGLACANIVLVEDKLEVGDEKLEVIWIQLILFRYRTVHRARNTIFSFVPVFIERIIIEKVNKIYIHWVKEILVLRDEIRIVKHLNYHVFLIMRFQVEGFAVDSVSNEFTATGNTLEDDFVVHS